MHTFERTGSDQYGRPITTRSTDVPWSREVAEAVEFQMLEDRLKALAELTGEREATRLRRHWGGTGNIDRHQIQQVEEDERLLNMSNEEALRLLAERDKMIAKESMKSILGNAAIVMDERQPVYGPVEATRPQYGPVQAAVSPSWLKY